MMSREEYRQTKTARHALRVATIAAMAPMIAELDSAQLALQKAHAQYLEEHLPGGPWMGERDTPEYQEHVRHVSIVRGLHEAEQPINAARQFLESLPQQHETIEWSDRFPFFYEGVAKVEAALAQANAAMKRIGRSITMADFQAEAHGERLRRLSRADLAPHCTDEEARQLCEVIGL